jgi:hypothetical protein
MRLFQMTVLLLVGFGFSGVSAFAGDLQPADFEKAMHGFYQESSAVTVRSLAGISAASGNCYNYLSWTGGTPKPADIHRYRLHGGAITVGGVIEDPITGSRVNVTTFRSVDPDEFAAVTPKDYPTCAVEQRQLSPVRLQSEPTVGETATGIRDVGYSTSSGVGTEDQEFHWFYVRQANSGKFWLTFTRDEFINVNGDRVNTTICYLLPQ